MDERIERFIAMAFRDWKKEGPGGSGHPSEEEIACFLEGKLDAAGTKRIRGHFSICDECASLLAAELYPYPPHEIDVPQASLERARAMVPAGRHAPVLDIVLQMKEFGFEIINATGDILFGQEFVPAAILRSRHITEFKDEVVVVRDFPLARIEVRIQTGRAAAFNVAVCAKDKKTQRPLQDLRVTLYRDNIELESRVAENGRAVFEHVAAGRYSIGVSGTKSEMSRIAIEVRQ